MNPPQLNSVSDLTAKRARRRSNPARFRVVSTVLSPYTSSPTDYPEFPIPASMPGTIHLVDIDFYTGV